MIVCPHSSFVFSVPLKNDRSRFHCILFWGYRHSFGFLNSEEGTDMLSQNVGKNFDVLLTVHLSIILVINQLNAQNLDEWLDAQNLVYNKFIICLYMFRAQTCFEHLVLIIRRSKLYYTLSGIITPVGGRPVHRSKGQKGILKKFSIDAVWLYKSCAPDGHLQVWWYQTLFNTILTSWWWAHSARNM